MVISTWTKFSKKDSSLICPFKYNPFLEGWSRFAILPDKKMPISFVGISGSSNTKDVSYKGYIFQSRVEELILNKEIEVSLKKALTDSVDFFFGNTFYFSENNIYEVMLKVDIKLKNIGLDIKDLSYKIESEYV